MFGVTLGLKKDTMEQNKRSFVAHKNLRLRLHIAENFLVGHWLAYALGGLAHNLIFHVGVCTMSVIPKPVIFHFYFKS